MKRGNKKNVPLFLSTKEVCKFLQIKPHILDYWEKRFPEIKPHKIGKRNFYKKSQLEILLQIKKFLEEGYSLEGIRKKLLVVDKGQDRVKEETSSLFPDIKITKKVTSKISLESFKKEEKWRKIIEEVLEELKALYRSL
ncbi:MAG: MerR family transcriptional regulator [Caldimicrobium sp.]|nr:MerR family transcriptional regulator [Caldimicrobium sp.]MCX7874444.1 MerR family transcriptional regulator [Caldimicrobium sp.]MDW8094957.1 MerR family transcriptional regulator [Caldimicrobium sp.]